MLNVLYFQLYIYLKYSPIHIIYLIVDIYISTLQRNEIIYLQLTGNLQIKLSECPFCAGTLTF